MKRPKKPQATPEAATPEPPDPVETEDTLPSQIDALEQGFASPLDDIWYIRANKQFGHKISDGSWYAPSAHELEQHLVVAGISSEGRRSPLVRCMTYLREKRYVDQVLNLSGYLEGMHVVGQSRILVMKGYQAIEPQNIPWPTLQTFLDNLLGPQREELDFWLKFALDALRRTNNLSGQALILVGAAHSGKSLLQEDVITPLLGGRSTDPTAYLQGRTPFNQELFSAEHLLMTDYPDHDSREKREQFSERLKQLLVSKTQTCFIKGAAALTLQPFWRVSISLNPGQIHALPMANPDMLEKLILLSVHQSDNPVFTADAVGRVQLIQAFRDELPGYAYYLQQLTQPPSLEDKRFGRRSYHDPGLLNKLKQDQPEFLLLDLLNQALFLHKSPNLGSGCGTFKAGRWEGKAYELRECILSTPGLRQAGEDILRHTKVCGRLLGELARLYPSRFATRQVHHTTVWQISKP